MANRTCSVDDCEGIVLARGWCSKHYGRWRRTGSLETTRFLVRPCSVEGCPNDAKKRTWCYAHYRRWRTAGDVQADIPLRRVNPPIVDGERQCSKCDEWKPLSHYKYQDLRCLACRRIYDRAWREANPDYWREWQRLNQDKVNATVQMRRAARLALPRERVDRTVLFERDDYTCQICMGPLDMAAGRFEPLSPTIDHIVPLSRGGHHTYENTQAAHRRCNIAKGGRIA